MELERDTLLNLYWRGHPRFRFFKNCPIESKFLDIGAGAGGLAFWKSWFEPERLDIKMYGVDLACGEHAGLYERFDALNLDNDPLPHSDGFFDVVYSTHVLEHLQRPEKVLNEILRVLRPGGLCYLEVPNHNTLTLPTRAEYKLKGYKTSTINFHDDLTHLRPYSHGEIIKMLENKAQILESGTIQAPYLAKVLTEWGFKNEDQEITTYGLWLQTEWSDYVCFRKAIEK